MVGLQNAQVESSAADVDDQNFFLKLHFVDGFNRGGRRLLQNPHDSKTCGLSGLAGLVALVVVEVSGHGDDCADFLVLVELEHFDKTFADSFKDFNRNVGRRVNFFAVLPSFVQLKISYVSFGRTNHARRFDFALVYGRLPDENFSVLVSENHARQHRRHFAGKLQKFFLAAQKVAGQRIGCAQIDSDNLHKIFPLFISGC